MTWVHPWRRLSHTHAPPHAATATRCAAGLCELLHPSSFGAASTANPRRPLADSPAAAAITRLCKWGMNAPVAQPIPSTRHEHLHCAGCHREASVTVMRTVAKCALIPSQTSAACGILSQPSGHDACPGTGAPVNLINRMQWLAPSVLPPLHPKRGNAGPVKSQVDLAATSLRH